MSSSGGGSSPITTTLHETSSLLVGEDHHADTPGVATFAAAKRRRLVRLLSALLLVVGMVTAWVVQAEVSTLLQNETMQMVRCFAPRQRILTHCVEALFYGVVSPLDVCCIFGVCSDSAAPVKVNPAYGAL